MKNKGKVFEQKIKDSFLKVPGVSIDRIPDQTMHHKGASNICDFIVYRKPYEYYIECKSVHGNTLPFTNIKDNQWQGLLNKSKIPGVCAGVICWWVNSEETWFIPISVLEDAKINGAKSINIKHPYIQSEWIYIPGKKKQVYFSYDMFTFFDVAKKYFN